MTKRSFKTSIQDDNFWCNFYYLRPKCHFRDSNMRFLSKTYFSIDHIIFKERGILKNAYLAHPFVHWADYTTKKPALHRLQTICNIFLLHAKKRMYMVLVKLVPFFIPFLIYKVNVFLCLNKLIKTIIIKTYLQIRQNKNIPMEHLSEYWKHHRHTTNFSTFYYLPPKSYFVAQTWV